MKELELVGKINAETPEVVVFAIQAPEFDDGLVDAAIARAVGAFEEAGVSAAAFAQRMRGRVDGTLRLSMKVTDPIEIPDGDAIGSVDAGVDEIPG